MTNSSSLKCNFEKKIYIFQEIVRAPASKRAKVKDEALDTSGETSLMLDDGDDGDSVQPVGRRYTCITHQH